MASFAMVTPLIGYGANRDMRMKLAFLTLVLFVLVFPESYHAQNFTATSKASTTKPKSRTDKRKVQAKKIVQEFFDGVFVKRNINKTFERLVFFEACDGVDQRNIGDCVLDDVPPKLGHQINSRVSATLWRYEVGAHFFILGTEPIQSSNESYPYSSSKYDEIVKEVFNKSEYLSLGFNGYRASKQEIEKRLDEIEKNWRDLEKVIFKRIDRTLYKKNIDTLKRSMEVIKMVRNGRAYYGVSMKAYVYSFILAFRGGRLKIIGLEDGI